MTLIVHDGEKLLLHYQVEVHWTRVTKWQAIMMGRDGPSGSCGKKALTVKN